MNIVSVDLPTAHERLRAIAEELMQLGLVSRAIAIKEALAQLPRQPAQGGSR